MTDRGRYLIGYTDMKCDDPRGQFYNWRTRRAMIVRADGTGRREIGAHLIANENTWTGFGRWWPDGRAAVGVAWESPENYAWEKEHRTFRMTEGNWLLDGCLVNIDTGEAVNLTAVERVSNYNAGLAPWPGDPTKATFAPIVNGTQRPYAMDADGRNKRDLSSGPEGFTYGCNVSPDGQHITYNKNYLVYVADKDGSNPRRVDEDPAHTFQFIPTWSPDGQWVMFLAGQHYKCHPHLVRADGAGLRKLADRGAYCGSFEPLKHPDFHSGGSDLPTWSPDSKWVYYTAQVGQSVELMRVSIDAQVQQLTHSPPGAEHCYPDVSPDSRLVVYGVRREGAMALHVADADGRNAKPITAPTGDHVQTYARWAPMAP
jgi:Tol biopolymer transport system component